MDQYVDMFVIVLIGWHLFDWFSFGWCLVADWVLLTELFSSSNRWLAGRLV
jgi:hypothetical protein